MTLLFYESPFLNMSVMSLPGIFCGRNGMVYEHLASYQTLENPKNGGVSGEIPSGYVKIAIEHGNL